jgi:hypothetical protein
MRSNSAHPSRFGCVGKGPEQTGVAKHLADAVAQDEIVVL